MKEVLNQSLQLKAPAIWMELPADKKMVLFLKNTQCQVKQ